MSHQAIKEYLFAIYLIYHQSSKKEKTKLLNQAISVTKLSRYRLIHRFNEAQSKLKNKPTGRPNSYNEDELLPHKLLNQDLFKQIRLLIVEILLLVYMQIL